MFCYKPKENPMVSYHQNTKKTQWFLIIKIQRGIKESAI